MRWNTYQSSIQKKLDFWIERLTHQNLLYFAIVLYMFAFLTKSVIEMFQLQGCVSELEFGYTAKMGGDVNMSSDILKLYALSSK